MGKIMRFKALIKRIIAIALTALLFIEAPIISSLDVNATSGSWTGGTVEDGLHLKVVWSESSQNPKANTSKVTATVYLVQDAKFDLYISAAKTLTI